MPRSWRRIENMDAVFIRIGMLSLRLTATQAIFSERVDYDPATTIPSYGTRNRCSYWSTTPFPHSWIDALLRGLSRNNRRPGAPRRQFACPASEKTVKCISLVLELCNRGFESGYFFEKMLKSDMQEMADFTLFALRDLPTLTPLDADTLCNLLEHLRTSAGVIPRNVALRRIGLSSPSTNNLRAANKATLCAKIAKPAHGKHLTASFREVLRRARLVHENILPFYGIFSLEASPACILAPWMEWNLDEFVKSHDKPQERAFLIFDVIGGLKYLHASDIVHGNLTSRNVLVSRDGRAMLADFEAYVDDIAGWRTNSSDRWRAPEVLNGHMPTKASDIWSFGCLAYQLVSGRLPYWAYLDSQVRNAVLRKEAPSGSEDRQCCGLGSLLEICWKFDAVDRGAQPWKVIQTHVAQFVKDKTCEMAHEKVRSPKTFWEEAKASMRVSFDIEQLRDKLECLSLISRLSVHTDSRLLLDNLPEEDAQPLKVLHNGNFTERTKGENRKLAIMLCRLVTRTGRFPQCYKLDDVKYGGQAIGEGGFGTVYKGEWNRRAICLKVAKFQEDEFRKVYIKELTVWAQLSHPNVLPLFGVFSVDGIYAPVSPWMVHGSLINYVRAHSKQPRLHFLLDVLYGLEYLHNMKLVHGDLRGQNVLVSHDGRALLTDFGMSNTSTATAGFTAVGKCGPYAGQWSAPETLDERSDYATVKPTTVGDIWSLACLVYEIMSRRHPYFQYTKPSQVMCALHKREIPLRPRECEADFDQIDDSVWNILESCWDFTPENRPGCRQIIERLGLLCPEYRRFEGNTQEMRSARQLRLGLSPPIDFHHVRDILQKLMDSPSIPETVEDDMDGILGEGTE
ncbi:Tyrosine-protein kinase CSK [Leucoagaricus sp. SymC.cos]|nr:Tyrosine-protein kinase CSK [Leucoagaricus sp. SymC.cos]